MTNQLPTNNQSATMNERVAAAGIATLRTQAKISDFDNQQDWLDTAVTSTADSKQSGTPVLEFEGKRIPRPHVISVEHICLKEFGVQV